MGKIIGKSALCFVGLCVVNWPLMLLDDLILNWGNITSRYFALFKIIVLINLMWFVVAIAYAYFLFRLFKNEPNRFLIIAMNGLFILILFIVLMYMHVDSNISYFMLNMMHTDSISVMILALMFKMLSVRRGVRKLNYSNSVNVLFVIIKSVAGLFVIIALSVTAEVFLHVKVISLIPFQNTRFVFLLGTIIYTGFMYKFFYQNKHVIMIMCVNAAVLILICFIAITALTESQYYLLGCPVLSCLTLSSLTGSAAPLMPLLSIVYRSVQKQSLCPVVNVNEE